MSIELFQTNELNISILAFSLIFFCYKNMNVFGIFLFFPLAISIRATATTVFYYTSLRDDQEYI